MGAEIAEVSIAWADHEGPCVARKGGYDIIHCEMCGFRHAVPLPSAAALEREYRETYYADEKPTFLAHAGEDQQWGELAQTDRLESFERLLGPARRRLLDIGSGPGFFLKTAKNRGWTVTGIEPSRQAAAHARGLGIEVAEGFFGPETAPALGRFDAINLNNVLEHVPDPVAILRAARAILEPGGALCVNVPNDFSPFQIAAAATQGTGEWWIAPPHHLNYFDFATLANLLQRLEFDIAEKTTSFPMEAFLLMGDNYTADPVLGRASHVRRKKFDLALEAAGLKETRRAFYRALAETGIGREAVVIAVKP
ncbi:MAG TPA: class I SAM-dependent methyltransferase [Rhizomicrobium sp.]|jgi:SAM-dependent methyltransferase|nr:class I SAM-dependent methyltransferase [Rhizomicrobium sp.]